MLSQTKTIPVRLAFRLTVVFAALVGGAPGVVAFDLLIAALPGVVLGALVARANTFATLRLLALAPFTHLVIGVVDQVVAVGTFVGVTVYLV